jgi:16S rRNA (guanine527-N7)-methyltransferase
LGNTGPVVRGSHDPADPADLLSIIEEARRLGFFGPRPAAEQLAHAHAVVALVAAAGVSAAPFLDLGSGGGLPGLALAACWPDQSGALLDASARKTAFLREAVASLGWSERISVAEGRAETLGRQPDLRTAFPVVVARSFARAAVTAELGGSFVREDGVLVVSEPPEKKDRWETEGLERLGLAPAGFHSAGGASVAVLRRVAPLDDRWPRAVGIPTKRPLW